MDKPSIILRRAYFFVHQKTKKRLSDPAFANHKGFKDSITFQYTTFSFSSYPKEKKALHTHNHIRKKCLD